VIKEPGLSNISKDLCASGSSCCNLTVQSIFFVGSIVIAVFGARKKCAGLRTLKAGKRIGAVQKTP
jgi:hypothetical protein